MYELFFGSYLRLVAPPSSRALLALFNFYRFACRYTRATVAAPPRLSYSSPRAISLLRLENYAKARKQSGHPIDLFSFDKLPARFVSAPVQLERDRPDYVIT